MNKCVIFIIYLSIAAAIADKYSSRYDDVDVGKILGNDRVLSNYIRCLMEEGSCTAEGRELKKTLPDALSSGCNKCNERQKSTAEKVINHLRTKRPQDWEKLTAKYDPQGEYKKRYEASIVAKKA